MKKKTKECLKGAGLLGLGGAAFSSPSPAGKVAGVFWISEGGRHMMKHCKPKKRGKKK